MANDSITNKLVRLSYDVQLDGCFKWCFNLWYSWYLQCKAWMYKMKWNCGAHPIVSAIWIFSCEDCNQTLNKGDMFYDII